MDSRVKGRWPEQTQTVGRELALRDGVALTNLYRNLKVFLPSPVTRSQNSSLPSWKGGLE